MGLHKLLDSSHNLEVVVVVYDKWTKWCCVLLHNSHSLTLAAFAVFSFWYCAILVFYFTYHCGRYLQSRPADADIGAIDWLNFMSFFDMILCYNFSD